ncbi:hypothetical protein DVH24_019693 [Malus domestica]|uniref:Ribosomal RNA adenine methylase transferase N-terminal domain-containing protein n=1 Tax=Malus domestica TaxID=3750 RepID=A0A498I401_MALDO|nr:hypothetical protein DVH24_019693 [Malus domestica]
MNSQSVKNISECFIIPHHVLEESQQPLYLAPTDLAMLSVHYIQKGLLLKHSLSLALVHFGINSTDVILEIGPGTGNLIKKLLEAGKRFIAVEIDTYMVLELQFRGIEESDRQRPVKVDSQDCCRRDPPNSQAEFVNSLLDKLKHSLSLALVHFYPFTGRFMTKKEENPHLYLVYVDCSNSPGARFIYATLDVSVLDILSPTEVPLVV